MRRRKLRWVAGLALLALVAVAGFATWPRPDQITEANCDRIRDGMSRAEVEAILGPPGDYSTGPLEYEAEPGQPPRLFVAKAESRLGNRGIILQWTGESGVIAIEFFDSGEAGDAFFFPLSKRKQSPLDNLVWRAKRQWRRWIPEE